MEVQMIGGPIDGQVASGIPDGVKVIPFPDGEYVLWHLSARVRVFHWKPKRDRWVKRLRTKGFPAQK